MEENNLISKQWSRLGGTRTSYQRDHALIAPDGHVPTALPAWNDALGVILISPAMGAKLAQTLVFLDSGPATFQSLPGIESFFFVLEGQLECAGDPLTAGSFGYAPPEHRLELSVPSAAKLVLFEKRYMPKIGLETPRFRLGHERDYEGKPFLGDPDATLQTLLPLTPDFDLAVNLFTYRPGATLPFVETHIMEHGLLMLDGEGIYRLNQQWYPVAAGDCLWMAPFCPQWFAATGKKSARYLYYKDVNRDAMQPPL